jgi:hypothetical protein
VKVHLSQDDIAKLPKWAQEQLRGPVSGGAPKVARKRIDLADGFLVMWKALSKMPPPVREFQFHPDRKWRWDIAWPEFKTALECDGGTYVKGGHSRGRQQRRDFEKQNAAVALGWRVFRATTDLLRDDPGGLVEQIETVLKSAAGDEQPH